RRQDILESDNLRELVWTLLTEAMDEVLTDRLREIYPYECVADWARRNLEVSVTADAMKNRDASDIVDYVKSRAAEEARNRTAETLGEFVDYGEPGEDEDDSGPEPEPQVDHKGLSSWLQRQFNVDLPPHELRKLSLDEIEEKAQDVAEQRVMNYDCAAVAEYLDPDYPLQVIAEWVKRKFEIDVAPGELREHLTTDLRDWLSEKLAAVYDAKERQYPIDHAIEECLNPKVGSGSFDFERLARWATWHYGLPVGEEELKLESFGQVRDHLLSVAKRAQTENALGQTIHKGLARYLSSDEDALSEHNQPHVRTWAAETIGVELTLDQMRDLAALPRRELEADLLKRATAVRRGDMNQLERYLLLQVYDTSWKDHLYAMDHLKSSIGLRSYAQIDPKIEYKREGLRLFEQMLGGINDKFTDLFFKARWVQREALNRIWSGQSAEHAEVDPGLAKFEQQRQAALQNLQQQGQEKPKPIIRTQPKVGRNDPCPCGSGKKYKKCCGR
ncbi:MAG: SEC-C domain-containing protein, partial [Planctomycetes bacterium]|nr:SEC-C domain-containing protein [Planctomycetota bacterium]